MTLYFLVASLAMIWPVYPLASRIRPLLLGIPFGLFYLVTILVLSFLVLTALLLWEERREGQDTATTASKDG